ncbi:MAG TPA: phosphodiester glycosidase family protein [Paludibacteraceae bacterium]|nr:phosphodiester glycosidase family protein [Paludibacteraceae bacterium]HPO67759.1 phosphodiester glycosidase family protein [Paludibacteraceae bacterium]
MKKSYLLTILFSIFSIVGFSQTINIDGKIYTIDTLANYKVGPSTQYTSLRLKSNTRLDVFFLKAAINDPYVTVKTVLARDSIYGTERPSSMATRKSKEGAVYFAGTNGDFFATTGSYVGMPTGGCMVDAELATMPVARKIFAFDENKSSYVGQMSYSGTLRFNQTNYTIHHANHIRSTNELVLYNRNNGKYTRTNAYGTEVLVELIEGERWKTNSPVKAKVTKIEKNKGNMPIPAGQAVLSGHGTSQTILDNLTLNDTVEITVGLKLNNSIIAPYTQMVGGDNRKEMLKDGVVETSEVWGEFHPRTAIGYSKNKDTVICCVVDGRGASLGVTTKELAIIMKSAGAYSAINLDGGGSSCMYVKEFGIMNTPSDGQERAVANGVFIVATSPTDNTIAEIESYTKTIYLPRYGVFKPKFLGYNQYGFLINADVQGVQLSCASEVGEILEDGRFVASGSNGGILTARYNNIETNIQIKLVTSAEITFRLDSVLVDHRTQYPIQVQAQVGLNIIELLPAALSWTIRDSEICSIDENGYLTGLKNGTTTVVGTLGDFKDSLKVTVQIPTSGRMVGDVFDAENWTLSASTALNAVLNTENLPSNWTHGAAVNYVYTSTRAPYIKLLKKVSMYGLPDTLKVVANVGDINISKVLLSLKANNALTTSVSKEFTSIPQNRDTELSVAMSELFDATDIAIYPVWFDNINFYLGTQTAGQAYTLALKEIVLCYRGVEISGLPSVLLSQYEVYPNPLDGTILNIRIKDSDSKLLQAQLFHLNGQCVVSQQLNPVSGIAPFKIGKLPAGTYLLKLYSNNEKYESVKIVIK